MTPKTYKTTKGLLKKVEDTPPSEIAIEEGSILSCSKCNSKLITVTNINGQDMRKAKNYLHKLHSINCPIYSPNNKEAGMKNAIRKAIINNVINYEGNRYKVHKINENYFVVFDKQTNLFFKAVYVGHLKITQIFM